MWIFQNRWFKYCCAAAFACGLGIGMTGCDDAGDAFEDAGDNIQDVADDTGDAIEDAVD